MYECQGIGKGATCGRNATVCVQTTGVDVNGHITPKPVYICEQHKAELDQMKKALAQRES
jgi:hypothetical protein